MGKFSKYVNREHIREVRRAKGITVEKIAEAMDLASTVSYYNLENGLVEPKITHMIILAELLGEPVTNFFTF